MSEPTVGADSAGSGSNGHEGGPDDPSSKP
jgi:hypothetical protein